MAPPCQAKVKGNRVTHGFRQNRGRAFWVRPRFIGANPLFALWQCCGFAVQLLEIKPRRFGVFRPINIR
jgi:hypothetical protein